MPRIKSKRKEYMTKDIGKIIAGKIREKSLTQDHIARCIGITQQGLSRKIKNNSFSYKDLIMIFSELEMTDEEVLKIMKVG